MLRVAVIGAGPSGLSACRHLASEPERFEFVCFEQCSAIGGTWFYAENDTDYDNDDQNTDSEERKPSPYQSCMYKNLRTNSPTDSFVFPDFPFRDEHFQAIENDSGGEHLRTFITHQQVLNYLRSYAENFSLLPFIRLRTSVEKVRLVKWCDSRTRKHPRYSITTTNTETGAHSIEPSFFDAVMVCTGRYSMPKWPTNIKNLDKFGGKLMHSKYYKHPGQFPASSKKIIVMGGGYSGIDIALDLDLESATKKQIILSIHSVKNIGNLDKWHRDCNVQLKPDISEIIGPKEVRFQDDSFENEVDAILLATGFSYDFPFLSEEDGLALTADDQRLTPLYKHLVHIYNPTLCFIGVIWAGLTIPQFDQQVKYFLALLKGDFRPPSRYEMLDWAEKDLLRRRLEYKWPKRYAHRMGHEVQREYMASLCEESGISSLDPKFFDIDDAENELRLRDPVKFKLKNYRW